MTSPPRPVLEMRGITKTFDSAIALSDVSFDVLPGEVHALCGENGAGKSTLMKVLSGVYGHGTYDGEIRFEGELLQLKDLRDSERHGIVIIHQELALSPHMSIAENIFLGNERRGRFGLIDWNRTKREAAALLKRVGLREDVSAPVSGLGVGKQQLVEIAKALSKEVKLLILDEPTAALNDEDSQHLLNLVVELKEQGIAAVIISHKLNEIEQIADRVTVIRDGRVVETLDTSDVTEDRIIVGMVGRDMEHRYPQRPAKELGRSVLRVENWTVYDTLDPTRKVVDSASFEVRAGEILGVCGLVGSGRTELAMSLFGHAFGSNITGTTWVNGREVRMKTVRQAIDCGLAYATEDRKALGLNMIDDIRRNITLASLNKVTARGLLDERKEIGVANGFRNSMNIKAPSVFARAGHLSGGNQQKVVLSKWIFADPDVLILDEPTRGIDVGAKYEIYHIIHELARDGKAILVVSSELPELLGIADRIMAVCDGRITGDLPVESADPESLMRLMTLEKAR
ncbi:xylose ABC transporter ATP-binding protein [Amycolatopsis deserti]|uniref:Xylose ABC transporter ATP-binding protein n=1 Tax=Amycolatopsis deserti TaxID=185696 RepID=A0ABQ3JBR7_9PSEU|nr:sugar ABC transporter ATP-binding protein [Amycolatopsis deserti]GHF17059.1 xylose ABC transporter ATP-binding protein [Amycolatopsis deserti]